MKKQAAGAPMVSELGPWGMLAETRLVPGGFAGWEEEEEEGQR